MPTTLPSPFRGLDIHSLLGEGAMGSAWLASHPALKTPFVIKTYKDPRAGFLDRLLAEARLAARVQSPHVSGVVDAGMERGIPFLVMQYIDGVDLAELIETFSAMERRLPPAFVLGVMADAARGLQEVHEAGVVHRDMKPSNLFVSGRGEACVGDFGIAVEERAAVEDGVLLGTPLYMAPEQWRGDPVDGRTDLYALGATALTALTGASPFSGANLHELARRHLREAPALPAPRDPTEAFLLGVIERCLRKSPDERYGSAEAVVRELGRLHAPPLDFEDDGEGGNRVGRIHLRIERGDLAEATADVIVNAANAALTMRMGMAAALRDAGGAEIEREAIEQGPVAMGDVVWTGPGRLRAKAIAHAVAAYSGAVCIRRTVLRALLGAERRGYRSVAMPALGTGVGRVPIALNAKLTLETIRTFARLEPRHVVEVRVVLIDEDRFTRWDGAIRRLAG